MKARAAEIATVTVLSSLSVAYCLFYYYLNDDGYSIYSGQLGFLYVLVCIPIIRFSLAWIVGLALSGKVIGTGRLTKIHVVAITAFALCIGCAFLIPSTVIRWHRASLGPERVDQHVGPRSRGSNCRLDATERGKP